MPPGDIVAFAENLRARVSKYGHVTRERGRARPVVHVHVHVHENVYEHDFNARAFSPVSGRYREG